MLKRLLPITFLLFIVPPLWAGTYWVHPYGTAANYAACSSATDPGGTCESGNCAGYCSYATANQGATAGDTINYKGPVGVPYSVSGGNNWQVGGIAPQASGTLADGVCTAKITYQNAPTETPVIQGADMNSGRYGIYLVGRSCIKITGFTIQEINTYAYIRSSHYNEITASTFTSTSTAGEVGSGIMLNSSCSPAYDCWNTHNWIHNNTIQKKRNGEVCGEGTDLIRIGDDDSARDGADLTAANNYNTIEDNTIAYASHTPLDSYGNYNVIRNNFFHNEPWWAQDDTTCTYKNEGFDNAAFDGKYGHRTLQITDAYERDGTFNLIEGNRSGFGSANPGNNGADGIDIAAPKNIVRYNDIYAAMNSCLMFKYGEVAGVGNGGTYNRAYNNTLYRCGYGFGTYYENDQPGQATSPEPLLAVRWYQTETYGNVLKNNLIYDSRRYALSTFDIGFGGSDSSSPTGTVLDHNWLTSNGDPSFTDTTLTDPTSATAPDFTLQAASGAIGQGTYLTLANGSGTNSTTLIVDDALYFQDGSWGSSLSDIQADWIKVGSVVVQISSINYATNTITLASAISWADNAEIRLYKKSDGVQVLYGAETDMGAHEYAGATTHTITASKTGDGGTLTPTGEETVADGADSVTYTATVNNGYRGTWSGTCGATGTGTTYQKTNVTADCTVVVTFDTIKIGGVR